MNASELTTGLLPLIERVDNLRADLEEIKKQNKEQAEKLANHLLNYEKHDNRRWTLVGFFVASLLALMANLIVTIVRK